MESDQYPIEDDRIEVQAVALDQEALQKLINKLTTVLKLLPEAEGRA